jgi:hypothetical protein
MSFKEVGQVVEKTTNINSFFAGSAKDSVSLGLSAAVSARDAAGSSSNAFLVSELEKRDPMIRQPLTTFTWSKNIPVRTGGGWSEYISNLTIDYASGGNADDANVSTNGATVMPNIQGNFGKDIYKTHIFVQPVSINEIDMFRQNITGRSLDKLLGDGVRLNYEKHMDKNVFLGLSKYGTTGILNNSNVYATTVAQNAGSTSTTWANKTADEILKDINDAIMYTWSASGYDMSAIPNHILLPFEQYNKLISRKVSDIAQMSIMQFLMDNNIAKMNGEELVFGVSLYGKSAGTGSTDRMVIYRHEERFIAVDELQPLTRMRTVYSARSLSYDTNYAANLSEVEFFYPQTVSYWDGI